MVNHRVSKKQAVFGRFRIPLPRKKGGPHRSKRGKGSYRRKKKYPMRWEDDFDTKNC